MTTNSPQNTNDDIADLFDQYVYWMTVMGTFPSYKMSTYKNAAFGIRNADFQVCGATAQKIKKINGIGEGLLAQILRICQKNQFPELEELMSKIPPSLVEMSELNGLGPKKLNQLWRDLGIDSIAKLKLAIDSGALLQVKGYGKKTLETLSENIAWRESVQGYALYAKVADAAEEILSYFETLFPDALFALVGDVARTNHTVPGVEILSTLDWTEVKEEVSLMDKLVSVSDELAILDFDDINVILYYSSKTDFETQKLERIYTIGDDRFDTDVPIFQVQKYFEDFKPNKEELITLDSVKSLIHCHTHYSDGKYSIQEMSEACIERGMEYMVLTDHSKSAFYADGLDEARVLQQHEEIDKVNKELAPFRIFKGIECDILADGSLDYEDDFLENFEIIIASVHSGQSMDLETATARVLKAVSHPKVNFLGHSTGRLLLRREGYPLDIKVIAEACLKNKVAIELNANPRRLDVDSYYLPFLLDLGVKTSINPDAHSIEGIDDIRWGVVEARRGGVRQVDNISSMSLAEFEKYFDIK